MKFFYIPKYNIKRKYIPNPRYDPALDPAFWGDCPLRDMLISVPAELEVIKRSVNVEKVQEDLINEGIFHPWDIVYTRYTLENRVTKVTKFEILEGSAFLEIYPTEDPNRFIGIATTRAIPEFGGGILEQEEKIFSRRSLKRIHEGIFFHLVSNGSIESLLKKHEISRKYRSSIFNEYLEGKPLVFDTFHIESIEE